jgi:hypothetical protein
MTENNEQWSRAILNKLRSDSAEITRRPLPRRWVDLIHYLDEQERKSLERPRTAARQQISLAEAELAMTNQEKLLRELMRTEEPTEEATALLENWRRKVAQAVAARN